MQRMRRHTCLSNTRVSMLEKHWNLFHWFIEMLKAFCWERQFIRILTEILPRLLTGGRKEGLRNIYIVCGERSILFTIKFSKL